MYYRIAAAAALFVSAAAFAVPAHALTTKECSVKYQAAKKAGTLNGMKWNDFRKAECGSDASASTTKSESKSMKSSKEAMKAPPASKTKAPAGVVFPTSVDKKYSNESPGKARMHTCLDQYHINKKKGALGGLKWIEKGGGYYSLCNARLKG